MALADRLRDLRLRAIENPDDRETLRVMADELLEAGDELGEHMRADLDGEAPELSEALRLRLLGRLTEWTERAEFAHGFLREVWMETMPLTAFRKLVGISEWEGVTTLALPSRSRPRGHPMPADAVLPLLRHPVCRTLRAVQNLSFDAFRSLCDEERHFTSLAVVDLPSWGVNTPLARGTLSVTELSLLDERWESPAPTLAWLRTWGRPVFDRVEHLRLVDPHFLGEPVALLLKPGAALRQITSPELDAERRPEGWQVHLTELLAHRPDDEHVDRLLQLIAELVPVACAFRLSLRPDARGAEAALRHATRGRPTEFEWVAPPWESAPDDIPF